MIPLYFDEESLDRDLVTALRSRGVDVITAPEIGMIGRSDIEHLNYATQQERLLYTVNRRDFYRLHAKYMNVGKPHAGILLAPQQRCLVQGQVRQLLEIISTKTYEQLQNRVDFLKND